MSKAKIEKTKTSSQSISQRLHEALGKLINNTQPGARLPSEPELALQLGVSRATLREAMRTFEAQGLIRRRQGSGTFVTHPSHIFETGLEVLESLETIAERIGLEVTLGVWNVEQRLANEEEASQLGLASDSEVVAVSRVIHAEGRPIAFLIDILPPDILKPGDLQSGFTGSVLDILLQRSDLSLRSSRTEINAGTASAEIARAMGIQRGDVLLRFVASLYTSSGRAVDYSYSYFLPGFFRFQVIRRVA